jgi:hypothetical protein
MRLASFSFENRLGRTAALNQPTWADGKPPLTGFARVDKLRAKTHYSAAVKLKFSLQLVARPIGISA